MHGTLVCAVNDSDDGRTALEMAVELSERLGLRLVLAYVSDGIGPLTENGDEEGAESVSMNANREGAARLLARLAAEHGVANRAERRFGTGDAAVLIGQIAAEEARRLDRGRRTDARSFAARPQLSPCRAAWQRDAGAGLDCAAPRPSRENGRMTGAALTSS
jgi:hypothetical protein